MKIIFNVLFLTFGFFCTAFSDDFLISVELSDQKSVQKWMELGLTANEFVGDRAFLITDGITVEKIKTSSLGYFVVDENPSNKIYALLSPQWVSDMSGVKIVYLDSILAIADITSKGDDYLSVLRIPNRLFNREQIPVRFWERLLMNTVYMNNIEWDPYVQSLADEVNSDSITSYIQRLQDFYCRFSFTDSSYAASQWLKERFEGWGYQTEFDSFYEVKAAAERNVVATSPGSQAPEKQMIICGHFDATSNNANFAPGADDNASGTAAALEAARVFAGANGDYTIKFIAWAAEEDGCLGSYHYAGNAYSESADIAAVLNYDMIGFRDDEYLDNYIQSMDKTSEWLSNLYLDVSSMYVPSLINFEVPPMGGSDWISFASRGYSSIGMEEANQTQFNPNYHSTTDLLSTLDLTLYTTIIKSGVSVLAVLSVYPAKVENVAVLGTGSDSSVVVQWDQSPEIDVDGYKIYLGDSSISYQDTFVITGAGITSDTLIGLSPGIEYFLAVTALDNTGRESYCADEINFVSNSTPLAPQNVTVLPIKDCIQISWRPNIEIDLSGYRVFRGVNQDTLLDSINITILTDTCFTDSFLQGENRYYYAVKAYDLQGNASPFSNIAYGRPLTLDQGILIVDETHYGGSGFPTDSTVDEFYREILQGYRITEFDYSEIGEGPLFADLAPYSTVVWHSEDMDSFYADEVSENLYRYLQKGGNLWAVGWKTAADFSGLTNYPIPIPMGNIVRDYMRVDTADLSGPADSLQGVVGNFSFPDMQVDESKIPYQAWGNCLRYVESYSVVGGIPVYNIDMSNTTSPYNGGVCAVIGSVGLKSVIFGFPLYFMNSGQAIAAAQRVMTLFGEEVFVEENPVFLPVPSDIVLSASAFIFTDNVLFSFAIPRDCRVSMKIYDSSGRLVKVLLNRDFTSGCYEAEWNKTDLKDRIIAPGSYFCRLSAGDENISIKITLTE